MTISLTSFTFLASQLITNIHPYYVFFLSAQIIVLLFDVVFDSLLVIFYHIEINETAKSLVATLDFCRLWQENDSFEVADVMIHLAYS